MTLPQLQALPTVPAERAAGPHWDEGHIAQCLAPGRYRLADGRLALQALSCLITPQSQDHVMVVHTGAGLYVSHVLGREGTQAQLCVPGVDLLSIAQPVVEVNAGSRLALRSGGNLDLASVDGSVSISARHFVASVTGTLVQNAQHLVTHAQHCVLQVAALLRMHGQQTLITAKEDMKLDAERISLG